MRAVQYTNYGPLAAIDRRFLRSDVTMEACAAAAALARRPDRQQYGKESTRTRPDGLQNFFHTRLGAKCT